MDLAVSDANVLIHFAKLNQLELLRGTFSEIFITNIVHNESVTQGKLSNKKDLFILEDFIQKGFITVKKIAQEKVNAIMKKYNIHDGESSVIALAKKYKINYCLTNEIQVRNVIRSEGLKVIGTLGIILKSYTIKKINKTKCIDLLKFIQSNLKDFRIHPKLVEKIIEEVNKKNFSTNA